MKVLLTVALYGLFFIMVEIVTLKTKLSKEISRKTVHILAGVSAAFLPFVLSFREITYVSLLFIPVMLLSKRRNILSSIHAVKRATYGEVYFPFAILATTVLFPEKPLYIYGLLIMAISDGFASVIGQRYGKRHYKLFAFGGRKSYAGSLTFLLSAAVIGFAVMMVSGVALLPALSLSIVMAAILTVVEGSLSMGLDNLVLSPLGACLLLCLTKLFSLA